MNRFCAERLQSLVRTLELNRLDEYSSLQKVANFATLVSTYERGISVSTIQRFFFEMTVWLLGFLLILEPFETDNATVPNPVFHFVYVLDSAPHVSGLFLSVTLAVWTLPLPSNPFSSVSAASSSPLEQFHHSTCILRCYNLPP